MWKLFFGAVVLSILTYLLISKEDKLQTIQGKRVIITGASSGIGEQLAYQFAKYGASTVITARRLNVLEKVAKKCKNIGSSNATHTAISADMSDLPSISNFITASIKQLGGLDIVVMNHVGPYIPMFFDESKKLRDYVHLSMDINFKSYIEVTGLVLPHLTKTRGSLVVVNSAAGFIPNPMMAAYSASKFALNGFFDSLRSQFIMEHRNVSITVAVLGAVDTEGFHKNHEHANLTRLQNFLNPEPANETAFAIVRASSRRDEVVYYPPSIRFLAMFYNFFSYLADYATRELYIH